MASKELIEAKGVQLNKVLEVDKLRETFLDNFLKDRWKFYQKGLLNETFVRLLEECSTWNPTIDMRHKMSIEQVQGQESQRFMTRSTARVRIDNVKRQRAAS
ncbi:7277_t:CDS:2 [Funneliformis caledonium]|uniref:7277_t:CDS:1 n=1 Tax=Funneliformis caledonium TaxID=1117310 RepID=A0A9N9EYV8_9GLOM|nr:7277_t:CDS:2 [Funneliformis caledonium]